MYEHYTETRSITTLPFERTWVCLSEKNIAEYTAKTGEQYIRASIRNIGTFALRSLIAAGGKEHRFRK